MTATMDFDLAAIPREYPQFGKSVWNVGRRREEVFGGQGSDAGKECGASRGAGSGTACGCKGGVVAGWPQAVAIDAGLEAGEAGGMPLHFRPVGASPTWFVTTAEGEPPGGSDPQDPRATPVESCCGLKKLCYTQLFEDEPWPKDDPTSYIAPRVFRAETERIPMAGVDCEFEWLEYNGSNKSPGGYLRWSRNKWNNGGADHVDRFAYKAMWDGYAGKNQRFLTDDLTLDQAGLAFPGVFTPYTVIWFKVTSCTETCCLLILVRKWVNPAKITTEASGSCGADCDKPPGLSVDVHPRHDPWAKGNPRRIYDQ